MKKISVLTANRAEYGLIKPIVQKLMNHAELDVRVIVTGAHLSQEFGLTYQEIEQDGIPIDEKIEILLNSDTPAAISKSMGLAMIGFADYFSRLKPDLLLVLGDRFETFSVCIAAMNQRIPIAHLYGGETTEGAVDESIRHAITKMSHLHFTSTEQYRQRVIQLGEHPDRVFQVGAIGVENITTLPLLSKAELESSIQFKLDTPYALVTFHPVTLENDSSATQFQELLHAIRRFPNMNFIFSLANPDTNGRIINKMIEAYTHENEHAISFASLGSHRYLSAMKYAAMVIGNSSSGLIEAPSLGIPTINIGDRQLGRMSADIVIHCEPRAEAIKRSIEKALTEDFKNKASRVLNPYGDGNTSDKVVAIVKDFILHNKIVLKKTFYDVEVT